MDYRHLKQQCAGCEQTDIEMSKEHIFPKWLIKLTETERTKINWLNGGKVNAFRATVPLCISCNHEFGKRLEEPVSNIFNDLECNKGISDYEAELLVRWLWKLEGLFWIATHKGGDYSPVYTLKERVLGPIDKIRGELVLAISLIERIDEVYGDKPLGIDSDCEVSGIYVAGVFSKIAIMVALTDFKDLIPPHYSVITLKDTPDSLSRSKLFYPRVGFKDDTDAVGLSRIVGKRLSIIHDIAASYSE